MNTSTIEASVQFRSIESRTPRRVETIGNRLQWLEGRQIDSDGRLMDESLQLRYQVYCVERRFLNPDDYPDQRERDEFDRHSLHLGVLSPDGALLATARLVKVNLIGLP
ncbi:MAG TPA: GNAT family N-acyltransferase, partial [Vicinamibacterales bacterium]|nr:GNAT family N-acyltransferase [Vicinamibacterales bacterium]